MMKKHLVLFSALLALTFGIVSVSASEISVTTPTPIIVGGEATVTGTIDYPIKIVSTAEGKDTALRQNHVLVLPTHDVRMEVSGHVGDDLTQSDTLYMTILRPDNTVDQLDITVSEDGDYRSPFKLHTRWMPGNYEILAVFHDVEILKISFTVTDNVDQFGGTLGSTTNSISEIEQYLNGELTETEIIVVLKDKGWSASDILDFIDKNPLPVENPYTFGIIVFILVPLLIIIVLILAPKRERLQV